MPIRIERDRVIPALLARLDARAKAGPNRPSLGTSIAKIIRFGEGSVSDQFARESLDSVLRGKRGWPKTKPFGNRDPSSKTLQRSGRLLAAWQGRDSASFTEITKNSVVVGVRGSSLPAAAVQQRDYPTIVRAKRRVGNDYAMRFKLGLTYGVWLTKERLATGLSIPPRPVGISQAVMRRSAQVLLRDFTGVSTTGGGA